jgi:S-adenosylmethionine:tRNA ribosyltransferase-isomerase
MPDPRTIRIDAFNYHLPNEFIARYPLPQRSDSKLLIYKDGQINDAHIPDLIDAVPANSVFIFNNTKVVEARLQFPKPNSSSVEVFCLAPDPSMGDITSAMMRTDNVQWHCLLGGAKKWKDGEKRSIAVTETEESWMLHATREAHLGDSFLMKFEWTKPSTSFAEVLHIVGKIPLPPYLQREAEADDQTRYQTVYAKHDGSVAAPTAGLHFTPAILTALEEKNCIRLEVTLHVGAGTFKPVKSETLDGHAMHAEYIDIPIEGIEALLQHSEKTWIPVGTTALRTLETLYQMGLKSHLNPALNLGELAIQQWESYERQSHLTRLEALQQLLMVMHREGAKRLITETQIIIAPSYPLRMVDALMTNFHQPQSTLLLLIAALVGNEWHRIYEHALKHEYRFLSYGDSSLLWRTTSR